MEVSGLSRDVKGSELGSGEREKKNKRAHTKNSTIANASSEATASRA